MSFFPGIALFHSWATLYFKQVTLLTKLYFFIPVAPLQWRDRYKKSTMGPLALQSSAIYDHLAETTSGTEEFID